MHTLRLAIATGAALFLAAPSAQAQLRGSNGSIGSVGTNSGVLVNSSSVPAGMCQVWINGLPANRQPAPTDCATARRTAPANSRILVGSRQGGVLGRNGDPRLERERERELEHRQAERQRELDRLQAQRQREAERAQVERQRELAKLERKRQKDLDKDHGRGKGHDGDDRDDRDGRHGDDHDGHHRDDHRNHGNGHDH